MLDKNPESRIVVPEIKVPGGRSCLRAVCRGLGLRPLLGIVRLRPALARPPPAPYPQCHSLFGTAALPCPGASRLLGAGGGGGWEEDLGLMFMRLCKGSSARWAASAHSSWLGLMASTLPAPDEMGLCVSHALARALVLTPPIPLRNCSEDGRKLVSGETRPLPRPAEFRPVAESRVRSDPHSLPTPQSMLHTRLAL